MVKTWFTSDLHFGHKNILKLANRPFGEIEHHDETLINNFNELVDSQDVVYILGDFAWNQSYENYRKLLKSLKGQKYFILGNHDNKQHLIRCQKDGLLVSVSESKTIQVGSDRIFLNHFPHREWAGFYHNAYHLYGHCHGSIDDYKQSTDIGVDCWEYGPVEWSEVKKYIDDQCEPNV